MYSRLGLERSITTLNGSKGGVSHTSRSRSDIHEKRRHLQSAPAPVNHSTDMFITSFPLPNHDHREGLKSAASSHHSQSQCTIASGWTSNISQPVNNHLTGDQLCDILRSKGLGDPRDKAPSVIEDTSPMLKKRQLQLYKQPYYMEKIKGQARKDFDIAESKVVAFCDTQLWQSTSGENQNGGLDEVDGRDANKKEGDPGMKDVSLSDGSEGEWPAYIDEDLVERVYTWLKGCRQAWGEGHYGTHPPAQ